ncbi:MAG: 1,2-phenylacetyl-CoA epoxidase subunit PaaE [Acidimicrobiia bacterium]|nr:1,2-phenylacetyl-CoA epoxidase subunit PaaE [Acidimicrobiia bacterium]
MTELEFHELRVTEVTRLTDDSVAITLDVPQHLADEFAYLPGQHVTMRKVIDGQDIRRSYSICANARNGKLRVAVKKLPGGAFSTYATTRLRADDTVEVMPPVGEFTIEVDPSLRRRAVAIAAGSGITPVMSLISTSLEAEPLADWTLIYGNRTANNIMFLEELEGLKDRYRNRLQLFHILSREGSDVPLLSGRIDGQKIETIHGLLGPDPVDGWYLCGPYDLVMTARHTLSTLGVDASRVHDELFFAGPLDASKLPPEPPSGEGAVDLTVILDGRAVTTRMTPETSILDAALRVRSELPFSCKGGMCATCKGRIEEGEVSMDKNYALVDSEVDAGFVLTCQAHPRSDRVVVRYDHR